MTIASIIFIYNRKLGILFAILSLLIGSARVVAGIHHPLDILGGVLIAIGATFASFLIFKYILKSS